MMPFVVQAPQQRKDVVARLSRFVLGQIDERDAVVRVLAHTSSARIAPVARTREGHEGDDDGCRSLHVRAHARRAYAMRRATAVSSLVPTSARADARRERQRLEANRRVDVRPGLK